MKTRILAFLVLMTFAFFACDKQDNTEQATDLSELQLKSASIAVNDIAVEDVIQEVNYETDFYSAYENLLRQLAHFKKGKGNLLKDHKDMHYVDGLAPVVSIDTAESGYPITITIEYGEKTTTKNGRVISGTVEIEISGKKGTDGSTRTISYMGCKIDEIGIEGTSTEKFNNDEIMRKKTVTSDITFTLADGTTVKRVGESVREWITGLATPNDREDDRIEITGAIKVTLSNGDIYEKLITEPLIELADCRHPVEGIVEFSLNEKVIAELNYGDGTCDNLAELTTDGEAIEIELKGKMPKADLKNHHPKNMDGKENKGGKGGH